MRILGASSLLTLMGLLFWACLSQITACGPSCPASCVELVCPTSGATACVCGDADAWCPKNDDAGEPPGLGYVP